MGDEERYEWQEGMAEISGLGGSYERTCRLMVKRGLEWFDAHPGAAPQFHGYKDVFGLMMADNEDAKALDKAMCGEDDVSGAMLHTTLQHVLYVRQIGWKSYVAVMKQVEDDRQMR